MSPTDGGKASGTPDGSSGESTITASDLTGGRSGTGGRGAGGETSIFVTGSGGTLFGSGGSSPSSSTGGSNADDAGAAQPVCSGQVIAAAPEPVDLYVMLDQSVSMADPVPNSSPQTTWWQQAQQGLTTFVNDPRAAGTRPGQPAISVGLQFFPLNGVAPQSCMADYATPEVELGLLPGNAAAIAAAVKAHQPTAFTPTAPALAGAIAHMKAWPPKHPGHAPVVALVTDGFPTECDPQDITDIAQIVRNAFTTEPRVRTFVIAFNLGSGGSNLDAIAEAGGTGKAVLIDKGDIGSEFVDKLLSVSAQTLPCKFDLPPVPTGQSLDPSKVVVTFTPSASQVEMQIPKVSGLTACGSSTGNGWFYDSSNNPTQILLCPGTCAKLGAGVLKTALSCVSPGVMTR